VEVLTSEILSSLSDRGHQYLADLSKKLQIVQDRTAGVALGYDTGFLLSGRAGILKSWTVEKELQRRKVPYVPSKCHLTGRGLFDQLAEYPDRIHLIDDVEEVLRDPQARGVLKFALWGCSRNREGKMERWIGWKVHGADVGCSFWGGIILMSNVELQHLPLLPAIRTRIPYVNLHVSDEEVAAKMRELALLGYPPGTPLLEPAECMEVVEYLLAEAARINRPLDFRLLFNSLADRLLAESGEAGCQWKDLVTSRIVDRPSVIHPVEPFETRARKKAQQLEIARGIVALPPEQRLHVWQKRVPPPGNSRATLYRRLDELARADALEFET
jgi:hypothetical protein